MMYNRCARQTSPFALKAQLIESKRPYNRESVRQLPSNKIGLYAIWLPSEHIADEWDCVYVGKSESCIRRRLLDHLRASEPNYRLRRLLSLFHDDAKFSLAYTATTAETNDLETAVIRDWDPETNLAKRTS